MSKGENKIMKRRLANAYLSSVISISLVLLLVGVASMLLVNAKSVSDYFKENMQVSVLLKDSVSEEKARSFAEQLQQKAYIKTTTYISKEQGQMELAQMLGEDFLDIFETSPVPASVEITLDADYVSSDSLQVVKNDISKSSLVAEVNYQGSLVDALNANLSRSSRRNISNICSNPFLRKNSMIIRAIIAMNAENMPWNAACTMKGALMN